MVVAGIHTCFILFFSDLLHSSVLHKNHLLFQHLLCQFDAMYFATGSTWALRFRLLCDGEVQGQEAQAWLTPVDQAWREQRLFGFTNFSCFWAIWTACHCQAFGFSLFGLGWPIGFGFAAVSPLPSGALGLAAPALLHRGQAVSGIWVFDHPKDSKYLHRNGGRWNLSGVPARWRESLCQMAIHPSLMRFAQFCSSHGLMFTFFHLLISAPFET